MSYSADECYDIYDEEFPRARKEHVCCACKETIPGGVRYARVFVLYGGRKTHYKRCLRCQRIHEHLRELCLGEEMWPEENLGCGLRYEDEWGPLPDEIAALAFASTSEFSDTEKSKKQEAWAMFYRLEREGVPHEEAKARAFGEGVGR